MSMENNAKIRINLNTREFEIEGSEEFINSHSDKIENFIELLKTAPPQRIPSTTPNPSSSNPPATPAGDSSVPGTFGEYIHRMPKSAKDVDKILIAGHYAQSQNADSSFNTKEATALLLEQGIKVSNPSLAVTRNVDSKRMIKLAKGKFKLSRDGADHLASLLNGTVE